MLTYTEGNGRSKNFVGFSLNCFVQNYCTSCIVGLPHSPQCGILACATGRGLGSETTSCSSATVQYLLVVVPETAHKLQCY